MQCLARDAMLYYIVLEYSMYSIWIVLTITGGILYGAYNILAAILYAMRTKVLATRLYAAHTPPFVQTSWRPFCATSSPRSCAELVNLLHLATALLLSKW
jgi:hypothetical protein